MTLFLIVAAVMIMLAFALVLPPLLKKNFPVEEQEIEKETNLTIARERLRELKQELKKGLIDQHQFEQARLELERNLAQMLGDDQVNETEAKNNSPSVAILLSILLPLLAVGIYLKTGAPSAIEQSASHSFEQGRTPDIETMVASLATKLEESPEDGEGWAMLGRSYLAMGKFRKAEQAFSQAVRILGEDASLLADYADAIGRGNGNDLTGTAKPLIVRALIADPDYPKARWLAGMLAYQEGDFKKVPAYLEPLLARTEPGTEVHEGLKKLIQEARKNSGEGVEDSGEGNPGTVSLEIRVKISDQLSQKVDPEDTVFIFAKATNGHPMPLAVKKLRVADLSAVVTLDDSLAMRPDFKLSDQELVDIVVRVSKSGNALAQSGDLQGEKTAVPTTTKEPVEVTIDQQIP